FPESRHGQDGRKSGKIVCAHVDGRAGDHRHLIHRTGFGRVVYCRRSSRWSCPHDQSADGGNEITSAPTSRRSDSEVVSAWSKCVGRLNSDQDRFRALIWFENHRICPKEGSIGGRREVRERDAHVDLQVAATVPVRAARQGQLVSGRAAGSHRFWGLVENCDRTELLRTTLPSRKRCEGK